MMLPSLINRYYGLRLSSVYDYEYRTSKETKKTIRRRLKLANSFFSNNTDVLNADLTNGSEDVSSLDFAQDILEEEKNMILSMALPISVSLD